MLERAILRVQGFTAPYVPPLIETPMRMKSNGVLCGVVCVCRRESGLPEGLALGAPLCKRVRQAGSAGGALRFANEKQRLVVLLTARSVQAGAPSAYQQYPMRTISTHGQSSQAGPAA